MILLRLQFLTTVKRGGCKVFERKPLFFKYLWLIVNNVKKQNKKKPSVGYSER